MKPKCNVREVLFLVAIVCLPLFARAQAATPQQTLQQYVTDLQQNPNDDALRQKIIALSQEMKPAPAIPEEARGHYVMAATFMESAKDATGFERAIEQYKAALLAAPWWAEAYKKLAVVQKATGHFDDAAASLNLYLASQPADARDAQDEIYKLRALKQAAVDEAQRKADEGRARENSPEAIAARKQAEFDAWLKGLDGARYLWLWREGGKKMVIDIHGNTAKFGQIDSDGYRFLWDMMITGRYIPGNAGGFTSISDDGNTITIHHATGYENVYERQQ